MNQSERERLQVLIDKLQTNKPITVSERVEVIKFLLGYQYLAARVAGEWNVARELEEKYASIL
jgi:hypothetical protein